MVGWLVVGRFTACQPLLVYFMPKLVQQCWFPIIYDRKMRIYNYYTHTYFLYHFFKNQCINKVVGWLVYGMLTLIGLFYAEVSLKIVNL